MMSYLDEERTLTFLLLLLLSVSLRLKMNFSVLRSTGNGLLLDELDILIRLAEQTMMILRPILVRMNEVRFLFGLFGFLAPFSVDATFRKLDE